MNILAMTISLDHARNQYDFDVVGEYDPEDLWDVVIESISLDGVDVTDVLDPALRAAVYGQYCDAIIDMFGE